MPFGERPLGELLAEELRRLDHDHVYAEALSTVTGVTGLDERSPHRKHIWYDPATGETATRAAPSPPAAGGPTTEEARERPAHGHRRRDRRRRRRRRARRTHRRRGAGRAGRGRARARRGAPRDHRRQHPRGGARRAGPPPPRAATWTGRRVHVWWGDERYVAGRLRRPQRPPGQGQGARPPAPRPGARAPDARLGRRLRRRPRRRRRLLRRRARGSRPDRAGRRARGAALDVVLLGVGPDGHCARCSPATPAPGCWTPRSSGARLPQAAAEPAVVHLPGPGRGDRDLVHRLRRRARPRRSAGRCPARPREQVPSAGARGRSRTLWLLDRDAASQLA